MSRVQVPLLTPRKGRRSGSPGLRLFALHLPEHQIFCTPCGRATNVAANAHSLARPEAGTCFEDDNWRPMTPYDSASIMHYPQCKATSSDLSFTSSDAAGVRSAY